MNKPPKLGKKNLEDVFDGGGTLMKHSVYANLLSRLDITNLQYNSFPAPGRNIALSAILA